MCQECWNNPSKLKMLKVSAKNLGHTPKYIGESSMSDQFICSCGWESRGYWDGIEYAWDEWLKHAHTAVNAAPLFGGNS